MNLYEKKTQFTEKEKDSVLEKLSSKQLELFLAITTSLHNFVP